ncbi:hypothetical protein [Pseudoalteromonas rubra]|uniref:hypothetical protein n=1 Tax=Pseudoalteromonas rubra TaxID=43658 RepID=UPI000A889B1B
MVEGVETKDDYRCLCDLGVYLMQGYLFAKPVVATLPQPGFLPKHLLSHHTLDLEAICAAFSMYQNVMK